GPAWAGRGGPATASARTISGTTGRLMRVSSSAPSSWTSDAGARSRSARGLEEADLLDVEPGGVTELLEAVDVGVESLEIVGLRLGVGDDGVGEIARLPDADVRVQGSRHQHLARVLEGGVEGHGVLLRLHHGAVGVADLEGHAVDRVLPEGFQLLHLGLRLLDSTGGDAEVEVVLEAEDGADREVVERIDDVRVVEPVMIG